MPPEAEPGPNEITLHSFFDAINSNDVDRALSLCNDGIEVTYPDPGRNWRGKDRGRVVMTAIFGQLARASHLHHATFTILERSSNTLRTAEDWGHPNMKISSLYTFDAYNRILSIHS